MKRRRTRVRFPAPPLDEAQVSDLGIGDFGVRVDPVGKFWASCSAWEDPLQVCGSGPVHGLVGEPGVVADEVDRGGGEVVLQAGLGQAQVAGAADAGDVGGLAHGALDSGPDLVVVLPLVAALLGAGLLDGLVDVAGAQRQLASGPGGGGAPGFRRACPAGGGVEPDHDGFGAALGARAPAGAGGALRAADLVGVPVDGERGGGVAAGPRLGGGVGQQRAEQGDPAGPGGEQQVGGGVAGIHDVLAGEQVLRVEAVVDGFGHRHIRHGGRGGGHMGDQVRCGGSAGVRVVLAGGGAGLGEVGLVAGPARAAFLAVAGIQVVGGDQPRSARREPLLGRFPPDHLLPGLVDDPVVLLYPDPAQGLDRGQLSQPCRRAGGVDRLQQTVAVAAVGQRQRGAFGVALRQVQVVDAASVHPCPLFVDHTGQPGRRGGGQRLQRRADALPGQFQPVEAAQPAQHVGGVGALPAARFDQSPSRQRDQQRVERLGLHRPRDQPGPELREHREVEPRIVQRQPERVLPVDRTAGHVGRLPVGQVLHHGQHQHDHQLGWGDPRPAAVPEQVLEPLVGPHLTQLVTDPDRQAALGERGLGRPGGVGGNPRQAARLKRHDKPILRPGTGEGQPRPRSCRPGRSTPCRSRACHRIRQQGPSSGRRCRFPRSAWNDGDATLGMSRECGQVGRVGGEDHRLGAGVRIRGHNGVGRGDGASSAGGCP